MGILDWLFGTTENTKDGTWVDHDGKGNKKQVTRKNGKVVSTTFTSHDGAKHRNEQAMQDYLRRNGGGR